MYIGRSARIAIILGFMIASLLITGNPQLSANPSGESASHEMMLQELINTERIKRNLLPLSWNETLASVASDYAREIARTRHFSHLSRNGATPWDRVMASGYYDSYMGVAFVGEIIEVHEGPLDISLTYSGVTSSPDHRALMTTSQATEIGIGFASFESSEGSHTRSFIICVQIFAYHFRII